MWLNDDNAIVNNGQNIQKYSNVIALNTVP